MPEDRPVLVDSEELPDLEYINQEEMLGVSLDAIYDVAKPLKAACVGKTILYDIDLETLLPGKWLNDKIINFYLELLGRYNTHCYYFSTYIYQMISSSSAKEASEYFTNVDFSDYDTFFFPIHRHAHWSLIKIQKNTIFGFDSLYDDISDSVMSDIAGFYIYAVERGEPVQLWKRRMHGLAPMQQNGDDCGVFCCAFAKHYASRFPNYACFTAGDIPRIRQEILHEILCNTIIYTQRNTHLI